MMSGQQTIAATPVGRREPNVSPVVPRESERVRLARVALTAALGVPGVQGADAGPGDVAVTGTALGARLEGVTCVAAPTGGYDVSLRLVCGLVALHPLAERVRAAVMDAAGLTGIVVPRISVHFAELVPPGTSW